jgi:hypothetical protein
VALIFLGPFIVAWLGLWLAYHATLIAAWLLYATCYALPAMISARNHPDPEAQRTIIKQRLRWGPAFAAWADPFHPGRKDLSPSRRDPALAGPAAASVQEAEQAMAAARLRGRLQRELAMPSFASTHRNWDRADYELSKGILHPDLTITPQTTYGKIMSWAGNPETFIAQSTLSARSVKLLTQAVDAVTAIMGSPEFRAGTCGTIGVAELRSHQWEIASALRDITRLRQQLPEHPGPLAEPIVAAQRKAIETAEAATVNRITALAAYAAQVAQADAARLDWNAAHELAARNDDYRDLVARTAADEHAAAWLGDDAAQATALASALAGASLAAEALALP